uniref:RGS domain-containing protein n=1 Tax=Bursaphelenchus xylophilus TaxID=6326 RepID=A0A1I7SE93_BURXY
MQILYKSLDALLNERQAIDAFRVWLRLHRRDDALDFYLAIIAFRKHVMKKDQKSMNMAYAMQKKYICPRTGLCDFLPQKLRQEISHKVVQYRARKQTPPVDIFDRLAPYVWSYLCEQHTLFVSSSEFNTVVKASEAGGNKNKMAEITAQRNQTANSRVPPLIGFAKFRCRDSQNTSERQRFRAKSEPPAKRLPRKDEEMRQHTLDHQDSDDNEFVEPEVPGSFPIRHEHEEDRELFARILSDRLAPIALQQQDEDRRRAENEFRLDLGGDTPSSWDEEDAIPPEALCEWSLAPSARVAHTRGAKFMQKSASIAFSESNDLHPFHQQPPAAPRLKKFDSLNGHAFRHPFIKDHLFAVHTHLVAPLSNKYGNPECLPYHAQAPPPPAPAHGNTYDFSEMDRQIRGSRCNVYQQFSDSSGFCSSESAHLHLAELNERNQQQNIRIPRDNSFPFEYRHSEDQFLPVSYKDESGVPFVSRVYSHSMTFGLFRNHFGIPARTSKR